jgi:hypothetical protein
VEAQVERTILITVRLRVDPAFEGVAFISLHQYAVPGTTEPVDIAEVSSTDEAIGIVQSWLEAAVSEA